MCCALVTMLNDVKYYAAQMKLIPQALDLKSRGSSFKLEAQSCNEPTCVTDHMTFLDTCRAWLRICNCLQMRSFIQFTETDQVATDFARLLLCDRCSGHVGDICIRRTLAQGAYNMSTPLDTLRSIIQSLCEV